MELRKTFRFEASHILSLHHGKCSRLHGHSWVLHVFVKGPINSETGFVMDFGDISDLCKVLVDQLDHRHLGQWWTGVSPDSPIISLWGVRGIPFSFYPTSESLLYWIGMSLFPLEWSKLALEETCTSYVELTREEFNATANKVRTPNAP